MADPPVDKTSVYHEFGESGPGWLRLRAHRGADVSSGQVAGIIEANPQLVPDDLVRDYVIRGLRGKLKKTRGHKRSHVQELRELYLQVLMEQLYPRLRTRRERQRAKGIKKIRGAYSSAELAHAVIGKRLGGGLGAEMTPEAVRNLISKVKKRINRDEDGALEMEITPGGVRTLHSSLKKRQN